MTQTKTILAEQENLRDDITELLEELKLPPLVEDEWTSILDIYPRRYRHFLSKVVVEAGREAPCESVEVVMKHDLRDDVEGILATVGQPPLAGMEWASVLVAHTDRHWRFVNDLIGEVRGDQHHRDVDAAIARERSKDEELSWSITRERVKQFCRDNDEPRLTDEQMDEFFNVLHSSFDQYEIIGEALYCLRTGTDRFGRPEHSCVVSAVASAV